MKVRAVTIGLDLCGNDFSSIEILSKKILSVSASLDTIERHLLSDDYEVQTKRLSLNSFELWLPRQADGTFDLKGVHEYIGLLLQCLATANIAFCTIGCGTTKEGIDLLGEILPLYSSLSSSALIQFDGHTPIVELAEAAARIVRLLSTSTPDGTANFRFCAAFNCPPNIPFFPVSYHEAGKAPTVTVGMECGDLLFLAFHGVTDLPQASRNLESAYTQLTQNLEATLIEACALCGDGAVEYGGIDASMNPGLTIQDSVGLGFEQLPPFVFGSWGTLATASTITRAIKSLKDKIKLVGYSGLMLPVMEDLTLAERAAEKKDRYCLRDLLLYSSVCGVGLDTVPVPGATSVDELVRLYLDIGAMSHRLSKPLTCRLFLMPGLAAGEMTSVDNPYLVNTKVFSME
jgi:uncharacterized protein (UPF0210 family)